MRSIFDSSQGLFLHIRTKCPDRENQWFQLTSLRKALGLTGRSVSGFTHRLRQLTQDSGHRFSPQFFTTHNLLVKNECKITSSQVHHLKKKLLLVRQVWGEFWRESGDVGKGRSPSLRQPPSSFEPVKNCTEKSASPAGVPRGCDRRKILVRGCVTPPWNDLELSDISFINPLRYAPIANATTGLI